MSEIELILRIMLAHSSYYIDTTQLQFNEKFINNIVPQLSELFSKYGFKTDVFSKDKTTGTYKKYKELMLSIFGDSIYVTDKPFNKNWFGLYDEELECLDMIHLSYDDAEEWMKLENNYEQSFI